VKLRCEVNGGIRAVTSGEQSAPRRDQPGETAANRNQVEFRRLAHNSIAVGATLGQ